MSPWLATVKVTLPWVTLVGETATLKSLSVTFADFEPAEALETTTTTTMAATMSAPSAQRARREVRMAWRGLRGRAGPGSRPYERGPRWAHVSVYAPQRRTACRAFGGGSDLGA